MGFAEGVKAADMTIETGGLPSPLRECRYVVVASFTPVLVSSHMRSYNDIHYIVHRVRHPPRLPLPSPRSDLPLEILPRMLSVTSTWSRDYSASLASSSMYASSRIHDLCSRFTRKLIKSSAAWHRRVLILTLDPCRTIFHQVALHPQSSDGSHTKQVQQWI